MKEMPERLHIGKLCDDSYAVCNDEYTTEYIRADIVFEMIKSKIKYTVIHEERKSNRYKETRKPKAQT